MATLALSQRPLRAFVIQVNEWWEHASRGSGPEANHLSALVEKALAHWSERAQVLVAPSESEDDLSYEHLLPGESFVVKVRYRFMGKLPPRRFDIDD